MRSSFAVASVLACLAVVAGAACKKAPKTDAPATTSGSATAPKPAPSSSPEAKTDSKTGHHGRATTLPFGTKPPKPEKEAMPAVPELPELAKQEKATPPTKLPTGEYACGASHSGESDYPLMCLEEKNHEKNEKEEKVVRVLLPYGHLKGKLYPLPKVVDHRNEQTESEIRNQGAAGTCTTFGTAASIDHSVTRWLGTPSRISTMELWARYHQPDLNEALASSVGQTFATEDAWPYDARTAWSWRECAKGGKAEKESACGKPLDKEKLREIEKKHSVVVEQVEWLPKDFELMRRKIAGGEDPVFAIKLPRHFKPVGKSGAMYVPDYTDEEGGHAMSLAGYVIGEKGDNYFLLHNSWGPKWGDGGYAWIHEATLAKHMMHGFGIIDARPVNGEKAHREGKVCPAGHAPDSLTGACEADCKDGGPTHNGVCPVESDCPKGEVNLWGECIGAAPSDSGKDEKLNLSWKCGPGGCVWTLPKHIGKCSAEPCDLSCPAPTFRAAKDQHGLTCVE